MVQNASMNCVVFKIYYLPMSLDIHQFYEQCGITHKTPPKLPKDGAHPHSGFLSQKLDQEDGFILYPVRVSLYFLVHVDGFATIYHTYLMPDNAQMTFQFIYSHEPPSPEDQWMEITVGRKTLTEMMSALFKAGTHEIFTAITSLMGQFMDLRYLTRPYEFKIKMTLKIQILLELGCYRRSSYSTNHKLNIYSPWMDLMATLRSLTEEEYAQALSLYSIHHNPALELTESDLQRIAKKKPEILNLPNYNAFGKLPALLDADAFALAQASQRLNAALSPTNSILIGSNTLRENDDGAQLKKVQSIIQDWDTKTPPVLGRDTVVRYYFPKLQKLGWGGYSDVTEVTQAELELRSALSVFEHDFECGAPELFETEIAVP
ncbi:hypothetical protein SERLADRAFT_408783 [Serpula lacrymans var. lacrymans S7.9]|uniref:Uncharacterized protein n=1 Tax=Serpula lacrymans var. lacrymans (strain S7.9) TaxID=578457 RepID=F8NWT4_SERL9|nr:uncharacterized protein SERLADRAFT_408783 [Serpula lacrymans var. lacrymans S7.9]EGO25054.1 hypothetical protein SERLADRAFT_408783 [Serpula lacrymans var. lacrymans S7.9]